MKIGVLSELKKDKNSFSHVKKFGLEVCQLVNWDSTLWSDEMATKTLKEMKETGVQVSAIWAGWYGPHEWDFMRGPLTLGLIPRKYRKKRIQELKKAAEWTKAIGVKAIITHFGFLPENITDPDYKEVLNVLKDIGGYCAEQGVEFWFETGQETPVVLLRFIEDSGLKNLGINLDPANIIM